MSPDIAASPRAYDGYDFPSRKTAPSATDSRETSNSLSAFGQTMRRRRAKRTATLVLNDSARPEDNRAATVRNVDAWYRHSSEVRTGTLYRAQQDRVKILVRTSQKGRRLREQRRSELLYIEGHNEVRVTHPESLFIPGGEAVEARHWLRY